MSERIKRTLGAVQTVALIAIALTGMVAATVLNMPTSRVATVKKTQPAPPVAAHYLDVLGLSPDALAAVGLNAAQAGTIRANLQAHLEGGGNSLQTAIDTWGAAVRETDLARRAVQSSKGTILALAERDTALANADRARLTAINAAIAAALEGFDNQIVEQLARIKANRPNNVPVQYLLTDRTQEQWRQLRDALSHKSQRTRVNLEVDPDAAAIISEADADPNAVTAAAGVANNLAGIQQAISQ